MNHDDLNLRLHDFFEAEAGGAGAPASLLARVSAIPGASSASLLRRRPRLVLLVAAILTALLVGGALAVGSWLSRPTVVYPTVKLPAFDVATSIVPCGGTLASADSDPVVIVGDTAGIAATGSGAASMRVYGDGRVIVGRSSPAAHIDSWPTRRLTPRGVRDLVRALVRSDLPGCRHYALTGSSIAIEARDAGSVYVISAGNAFPFTVEGCLTPSSGCASVFGYPQATTSAEAAAVAMLVQRLADPDLGLPADDWAGGWSPHVPSRWRVSIGVDAGPSNAPLLTADLTLPNGSPLREIGDYLDTTGSHAYMERCAIVDAPVADAILSALKASGAQPTEGSSWQFSNAVVSVHALLPPDPGCSGDDSGVAQASGAASPADTTVCRLSPDTLTQSLGGTWYEGLAIPWDSWPAVGDSGWPTCLYQNSVRPGTVSVPSLLLYLDPAPVPASSAPRVAEAVLGSALTTETVAGHPIFFNGCPLGTVRDGCQAAAAVSVLSDFIVLARDGASRDELRTLAEAVIGATE